MPVQELIRPGTRVFGMGSCFADNVVGFLRRELGVEASSFAKSRFYDPVSIRQAVQDLLTGPHFSRDDMFVTEEGLWVNPFRDPKRSFASYEELAAWTRGVDEEAAAALRRADVLVITLGGTENWRHPGTGKTYVTIPFPEVFNSQMPGIAEFHHLSHAETLEALENVYQLLRQHLPDTHLILTVSPVRMAFTVTDLDVRVANCYAKSVLRTAVGELTRRHANHLHYFHSYELFEYDADPARLFASDQRHPTDAAVSMVMSHFAHHFVARDLLASAGYDVIQRMLSDGQDLARIHRAGRVDPAALLIGALRTVGLHGPARAVYRLLSGARRRSAG